MTVQTRHGVEGALIGDADLVDGIVVNLLCLLLGQQVAGCECIERQSHEDAVEPHLIGVDGLMPIHLVNIGTGLVLQLAHHELHGFQVLGFGPLLIHAGNEVSGADVVQVVVLQLIALDAAIVQNHRVGIFLTVAANVLTTILQIGVEHGFQLDAHDVAPLGFLGKVEHERLRRALHLRVGEPLGIVLIGFLQQYYGAVHLQVVEAYVTVLTGHGVACCHTVELTVLDIDVIHLTVVGHADNHHAVFRLLTRHVLHPYVAHGGVETTAAHLARLVVGIDFQHRLLALSDGDVAHVDVLNHTATA